VSVYLDDGDVRLYHGDVLEQLHALPDGCVDCIITSPPYYGLRDYGTGTWEGGNPDCDHQGQPKRTQAGFNERYFGRESVQDKQSELRTPYRDTCGKCGATRIDSQIGLEATPDEHVAKLVAVFREARRVLADHGTLWLNYGDAYASGETGRRDNGTSTDGSGTFVMPQKPRAERRLTQRTGLPPKNLLGMPWRVAFALQADGWILRSDIIWAKPNPMPESVTDRPTKAHEYVFLFAKQPRYAYDADAIREQSEMRPQQRFTNGRGPKDDGYAAHRKAPGMTDPTGRNARTVWEIATQPFPEAHFATFPEELVRRCLLAGCPAEVCRTCGKARERMVQASGGTKGSGWQDAGDPNDPRVHDKRGGHKEWNDYRRDSIGWTGTVLDPFMGSGTTALVARKHGRRAIGIDLSVEYLAIAARRLQQLSLLGGAA
jgi:DNA modification methylase